MALWFPLKPTKKDVPPKKATGTDPFELRARLEEGPMPGDSGETLDDLRQECAVLRQRVAPQQRLRVKRAARPTVFALGAGCWGCGVGVRGGGSLAFQF